MSTSSLLLASSSVAPVCPLRRLSHVATCRRLRRVSFPAPPLRPKAYGQVGLLVASRRGHLSCGRRGSLELVVLAVGRGLRLIMP